MTGREAAHGIRRAFDAVVAAFYKGEGRARGASRLGMWGGAFFVVSLPCPPACRACASVIKLSKGSVAQLPRRERAKAVK